MYCNLGQIPRVQLDLCETHANWSHLRSSHAHQFDFVHLHTVTTGSFGRIVQVRNIFLGSSYIGQEEDLTHIADVAQVVRAKNL